MVWEVFSLDVCITRHGSCVVFINTFPTRLLALY